MSDAIGPAERRALEQLRAQAPGSAVSVLKQRARVFAKRPMALENLYPGLAAAAPDTMIAIAQHLLDRERGAPRRWFGFGGEVGALNAKAALLSGRALRRTGSR
jgi:hypothetical protein